MTVQRFSHTFYKVEGRRRCLLAQYPRISLITISGKMCLSVVVRLHDMNNSFTDSYRGL